MRLPGSVEKQRPFSEWPTTRSEVGGSASTSRRVRAGFLDGQESCMGATLPAPRRRL